MTALAPVLQAFFTDRLIAQRQVSGHTVAAYRDTFWLLLGFAQNGTCTAPSDLRLDDLNAGLIGAFLEHLRNDRNTGAGTRKARLATRSPSATGSRPPRPTNPTGNTVRGTDPSDQPGARGFRKPRGTSHRLEHADRAACRSMTRSECRRWLGISRVFPAMQQLEQGKPHRR